jgi:hypothetical protein
VEEVRADREKWAKRCHVITREELSGEEKLIDENRRQFTESVRIRAALEER